MWTTILLVIGAVFLLSAAYAAASGAPWVPTKKGDVARLQRLLNLKSGDKFVELGCGNGRVCRGIAEKHSDVEVVGVELSLLQYLVAQLQGARSHTTFKLQNVFAHDLSGYNAVYMFLMPETYQKIESKLLRELQPGAQVFSYVWPIPGWEDRLVQVDKAEGKLDLFLYKT